MNKKYVLGVVGGGISGCALVYEAARYSDIKSIALFEKYGELGSLNSKSSSNSQTIHFGDIETNYTVKKACTTKENAKMVEKYCIKHGYENKIIFSHQKMALGVGEEESIFMLDRFEEFSTLFPNLEVWDREELKKREPSVVYDENGKERSEYIVGVGSKGEWTTVDYGLMTKSFIENAKKEDVLLDVYMNSKVDSIEKKNGYYEIRCGMSVYECEFVVVNAGAHSLLLAHGLGYGETLSCLPIAGSFYMSKKKILEGKVYMVQNPKLPFAALHGDPDILEGGYTRFGPTALVLPKLERYKDGTYIDFVKSLRFDGAVMSVFYDLLKDSDIRNYIFKNFLFEVPYINKSLFVKDAKKIVPSLKEEDIVYAKGFGGVRPQVIDKKEGRLLLGEASINTNEGIIFNMTPSPGATSCLGNAYRDLLYVVNFLGLKFDTDRFKEELLEEDVCKLELYEDRDKLKTNSLREGIRKLEERYFENLLVGQNEYPSCWEEPYNPWTNKRNHWSF